MSGKGRKLSPEDAELWARITRSIRPLPGRESRAMPQVQEKAAPPSSPAPAPKARKRPAPAATPPPAPPPPRAAQPSSPGTLNRRERQRMARGKVEIEARMDLHGLGVEAAHAALRAFIIDSRRKGLRTVLVITGKGASPFSRHTLHGHDFWHAPERAGKLRQLLPRWLAEAGIAEHVAGWQPAHPRHGGGGAFYIRLRRSGR